jgi:hypothetical protein
VVGAAEHVRITVQTALLMLHLVAQAVAVAQRMTPVIHTATEHQALQDKDILEVTGVTTEQTFPQAAEAEELVALELTAEAAQAVQVVPEVQAMGLSRLGLVQRQQATMGRMQVVVLAHPIAMQASHQVAGLLQMAAAVTAAVAAALESTIQVVRRILEEVLAVAI